MYHRFESGDFFMSYQEFYQISEPEEKIEEDGFEPGGNVAVAERPSEFGGMAGNVWEKYSKTTELENNDPDESEPDENLGVKTSHNEAYATEGEYNPETGSVMVEGVELYGSDSVAIALIIEKFEQDYEGYVHTATDEFNGVTYESNYFIIGSTLRIETIIIKVEEELIVQGEENFEDIDDGDESTETQSLFSFIAEEPATDIETSEIAAVAEITDDAEQVESVWTNWLGENPSEVESLESSNSYSDSDAEVQTNSVIDFDSLFWTEVANSTVGEKIVVKESGLAKESAPLEESSPAPALGFIEAFGFSVEPTVAKIVVPENIEPKILDDGQNEENRDKEVVLSNEPDGTVDEVVAETEDEEQSQEIFEGKEKDEKPAAAENIEPARQRTEVSDLAIPKSFEKPSTITTKPAISLKKKSLRPSAPELELLATKLSVSKTNENTEPTVDRIKSIKQKDSPTPARSFSPTPTGQEIFRTEKSPIIDLANPSPEAKIETGGITLVDIIKKSEALIVEVNNNPIEPILSVEKTGVVKLNIVVESAEIAEAVEEIGDAGNIIFEDTTDERVSDEQIVFEVTEDKVEFRVEPAKIQTEQPELRTFNELNEEDNKANEDAEPIRLVQKEVGQKNEPTKLVQVRVARARRTQLKTPASKNRSDSRPPIRLVKPRGALFESQRKNRIATESGAQEKVANYFQKTKQLKKIERIGEPIEKAGGLALRRNLTSITEDVKTRLLSRNRIAPLYKVRQRIPSQGGAAIQIAA